MGKTAKVSVLMDAPSTSNQSIPQSPNWAITTPQDDSFCETINMDEYKQRNSKRQSCKEKMSSIVNKIFPLPWWSFIIGYFLSFASVATCTFLLVEFGGVLGEEKTSEWLASMSISLLQSILIIQPLKIIAIVTIYTLVFKTPEEDEDEVSKELTLMGAQRMHEKIEISDLNDPDKYYELQARQNMAYPPPPDKELESRRLARQKDKATQILVNDCLFYCFFLAIMTTMAYTNQDYRTFLQNDAVLRLITEEGETSFQSIRNISDVWNYLESTFIPNLYPAMCYNNEKCDLRADNSINDLQFIRMRQAQVRQLRVSPLDSCIIAKEIHGIINHCRDTYSIFDEETLPHKANWKPYNDTKEIDPSSPWKFTSALHLYGIPHSGIFATYGGGGYVVNFGPTREESLAKMQSLKESQWIDINTRGLFFEFLLYNVGTNLYTFSVMMVEQSNIGGFFAYPKLYTFRLNRYFGLNAIVYLAIDGISAVFIFMFVIREIKAMRRKGKQYFKDFWSRFDLCLVIACFIGTGFYGARIAIQKLVSYYLDAHPDRFINFEWIAFWEECNQAVVGVVVFLFTIRSLKILAFNYKISMLARVLSSAKLQLGNFLIMFALIFLAFAQMGYLLFFKNVDAFQSFGTTVETLGVMSLNKFEFMKFAAGGGTLGLIYFFIYMVFIAFVMMNFFVTIINDVFAEVKNHPIDNEYEIVDYCLRKLSSMFAVFKSNKQNYSNMEKRFQYLEDDEDDWFEKMKNVDAKLELYLIRYGGHDQDDVSKDRQDQSKDTF